MLIHSLNCIINNLDVFESVVSLNITTVRGINRTYESRNVYGLLMISAINLHRTLGEKLLETISSF